MPGVDMEKQVSHNTRHGSEFFAAKDLCCFSTTIEFNGVMDIPDCTVFEYADDCSVIVFA